MEPNVYPAEIWTGPKLRSYFNCLNIWVVKQKKHLALLFQLSEHMGCQTEETFGACSSRLTDCKGSVGEYDYNHSCYDYIKGAIFNVYFEHLFSKVVLLL